MEAVAGGHRPHQPQLPRHCGADRAIAEESEAYFRIMSDHVEKKIAKNDL
jgi:hypothetical protein